MLFCSWHSMHNRRRYTWLRSLSVPWNFVTKVRTHDRVDVPNGSNDDSCILEPSLCASWPCPPSPPRIIRKTHEIGGELLSYRRIRTGHDVVFLFFFISFISFFVCFFFWCFCDSKHTAFWRVPCRRQLKHGVSTSSRLSILLSLLLAWVQVPS